MNARAWSPSLAVLLACAAACGGGGGSSPPPPTPECDKAANVTRRAELLAAQPALPVAASSGKTVKTFTTTFTSLAGDPAVQCPVALQFKDLSGDGALQPYEDWTRTAAERADDLVARMSAAEKRALLAHAVLADVPTAGSPGLSTATRAVVDAGIRFGLTAASTAELTPRATWANYVQERCEASAWGIPFVLSMEPAHASAGGRVKANGFSQWPGELGLGATRDLALVETFGRIVSQEYRAIGVRMALSPVANLATEPRWWNSQFGFGEDSLSVADLAGAYVKGLQGATLGKTSVAAVIGHFPGAGAAKGGWDARLAKGKLWSFSGTHFDDHAGAFQKAFASSVAGVMPGYGIPETGGWTGLGGLVSGATIEQVAASFNAELLTTALRGHYGFGGLVVAPRGAIEDAGVNPLGAPWGVEGLTRAQRVAKAVGAGVDQLVGLNDTAAIDAAGLGATQVDPAAKRALTLAFQLGLFENPYVVPADAPALCNTDAAITAGRDAMAGALVLLVNKDKPVGWLNGHTCPPTCNGETSCDCDGTQSGDPGNAGNGTMKVLPAPPGRPYIAAGCDYWVGGDFDYTYVNGVSTGYGFLTNLQPTVKGCTGLTTEAQRMALADYVFIRIAAPYTADPDSGPLGYPLASLEYAGNDPAVLAPVAAARAAIDGHTGCGAPSRAQIVVFVDAGRASVVSELLSATYGISALYVDWFGTMPANMDADKIALDVAFGIVGGRGRLPVGLPASDGAAAAQLPDVAGDGQDAAFPRGAGLSTPAF